MADFQERIEMLRASAMKSGGQEIPTGTATAIEITNRQIAELDEAIARCRHKLDAQR
jgi:uncharacterized protein (DUF39 family)